MSGAIAILCPGPSLPRYWQGGDYSSVIGVNTAAHRYAVDWLAFADWHIIRGLPHARAPLVGYLCKEGMRPATGAWADLTRCFDHLPKPVVPGSLEPKCGFTFANALAWAQLQAPAAGREIHVYGFDCADAPTDFTGQPGDHSAARWSKELPWIRCAWGLNVTVHSDLPASVHAWLIG